MITAQLQTSLMHQAKEGKYLIEWRVTGAPQNNQFVQKSAYLKITFDNFCQTQLKTAYLRGPHSSKPRILRPFCTRFWLLKHCRSDWLFYVSWVLFSSWPTSFWGLNHFLISDLPFGDSVKMLRRELSVQWIGKFPVYRKLLHTSIFNWQLRDTCIV